MATEISLGAREGSLDGSFEICLGLRGLLLWDFGGRDVIYIDGMDGIQGERVFFFMQKLAFFA